MTGGQPRPPRRDDGLLEVEAKVALDGPEPVRSALHRLGAAATPAIVEVDVFFTHAQRDLPAADEALRLRSLTPHPAAGPGGPGGPGAAASAARYELTHKGPRQAGAYKAREERTVRLADDPTELLAALGFRPTVRLRKTRERHRLGTLEVTLDHVEGLGWFAEVEALGADARTAEAAVQAALRELGLDGRPRVSGSYVELALAAGAAAVARE
ncbi:MAG TPA: class IV adenylate cyclase [Candidatus Thermoplasmatota archaeon]|nr:class IV adenylate cyclase [Candidatus Thermoplasmatota archaeon]